MKILPSIGQGTCDMCGKVVSVVWGKCHCDDECELETWICAECEVGMTPD